VAGQVQRTVQALGSVAAFDDGGEIEDGEGGHAATLQRRRQEASGMVSNCAIEPEPAAACQAGRCVLKPAARLAR
jgi:hypothetical protein